MQTTLDCFPCFLRQALQASRFAGANDRRQRRIVDLALERLGNSPTGQSPLELASGLYEMVRRETGNCDPYRPAKKTSNNEALRWLPTMRALLKRDADPLGFALKVAVAGNIMDYGAFARFDVSSLLDALHQHQFTINDRASLEARLQNARSLSYFADNAGEIVFDRLLIEQLVAEFALEEVRLVVRTEPFLNDACEEDARVAGITRVPGVELLSLPISPRDHDPADWARATGTDVIIAKGMANFENYSDLDNFHFLFIAKCDVISELLTERCGHSVSQGDWVLHQPRLTSPVSDPTRPRPVDAHSHPASRRQAPRHQADS